MIEVRKALQIVLDSAEPLGLETVGLTGSLDRVLAEDICSDSDIPGFDNSAMDGYAVKSADVRGACSNKPKVLEVIANLKAGDITGKILKNNQAVRIMTGAPVPQGADSIIMVEDTQKSSEPAGSHAAKKKEFVWALKELRRGENIRKTGEDIKKGELIIRKGTMLKPGHIGIMASLGKPRIKVIRKPKVAILATGNEIIGVDDKLVPGKLRSSNTYTLYSQVVKCGGIPSNLGIAKDNPIQLEKKIKQGLDCDIILTSGGVSVGDYDLVKDILAKIGTNIRFWKVAMRPGKPLVFGTIKDKLIFGLPGNPVSSMVSFEVFVRPVILKMLGLKVNNEADVDAVSEESIVKKKGLKYFLRAHTMWRDGIYLTRTTGPQGSGILKSMAAANSFIVLDEKKENIKKGSRVRVRFFS